VLELDHLIVFRRGPGDVDVAGLVLDEGTRHVGQGTRNRRIVFPDSYIELLWVDSPGEARASGLRFEERCTGDACPFGVVFRGRLPETVDLVEYTVPAGPTLLVGDDPRTPFLAVHEADDLSACGLPDGWPRSASTARPRSSTWSSPAGRRHRTSSYPACRSSSVGR
jgi:hypothetical protein